MNFSSRTKTYHPPSRLLDYKRLLGFLPPYCTISSALRSMDAWVSGWWHLSSCGTHPFSLKLSMEVYRERPTRQRHNL
jgi:hypothetical protein